jgi:hypothetical protein
MFIALLIMKTKTWEQAAYPLTNEWKNSLEYTHIVEHLSPMKRNSLLIPVEIYMNLRKITLRKRSQKKSTYYKIQFIGN